MRGDLHDDFFSEQGDGHLGGEGLARLEAQFEGNVQVCSGWDSESGRAVGWTDRFGSEQLAFAGRTPVVA